MPEGRNPFIMDQLLLDGEKLDARIEENVVRGEMVQSMQGTSTVELEIHDPRRVILRNGILSRAKKPKSPKFRDATQDRLGRVLLTAAGDPYRLAGVEKRGSSLNLTFEHEITALMRSHTRKVVRSRGMYTRAQFIAGVLAGKVEERRIVTFMPSSGVKQKTEEPDKPKKARPDSFMRVAVKGTRANSEQRRNMKLVAEVIEEQNASERPAMALIEACIQESTFSNLTGGDRDSVGILQLRGMHLGGSVATRGGRRDVKLCAKLFLTKGFWGRGGAIELARKNPNRDPGWIAQQAQGSGFPLAYSPHEDEAKDILAAMGGSGEMAVTYREQYNFRAGSFSEDEIEDYWDAAMRLAEEVNWRLYVADNKLFYLRDSDLMKLGPVALVSERPAERQTSEGVQYVGPIDFDWDYRKPAATASFTTRAGEFFAFPGAVLGLVNMGPADGYWLIEEIRDELDSYETHFALRRPAPAKLEPAPKLGVREISRGAEGGGDITTEGGAKGIVDQVAAFAHTFDSNIYAGSGFRANSVTSSGNVSDHAFNSKDRAARDIGYKGINFLTGPPHPSLDRACVAIGRSFGRDYVKGTEIVDTFQWEGFRVQIIWRSDVRVPGHMGHIHIGVRKGFG